MKITLSKESLLGVQADLLVIGVAGKRPAQDALVRELDAAVDGALVAAIKDEEFKGKRGQTLRITPRGLKAKKLMLIGLGDGELDAAAARLYAVRAARAAAEKSSLALFGLDGSPGTLGALADGVTTGAYKYTRYLTGSRKPKRLLGRAVLLIDKAPRAAQRKAVEEGQAVGESVNLARDLVNTPPNDLTATDLANIAAAESKGKGITCKVYDKKAIERLGMPLLLAVNQGSTEEPRFIHMRYRPKTTTRKTKKVVFVGKGLTFDSGGLCIKPPAAMLDMKMDMAGSATTIGTVLAAARLGLSVEVHGIVASTDNMSGGNAYRPGDVFPSRNGKSVEIINTDAEGRLVLADALAFATELKPDYLIDHATLTGACLVALGGYRAGLFANDEKLVAAYEAAGKRAGEDFWNLPLDEDLRSDLKSSIADLKHTGGRFAGTITAALFLSEFVGDCKWAHLDIAGPAYMERTHGLHPKGGTGFGVLTAIEFLRAL